MTPTTEPDEAAGPEFGSPTWWDERYRTDDKPWDTGIVPPEVVALLDRDDLPRGWAFDLGCGSGVSSRYLARHGFRVVGLDLAHTALVRASAAARASGLPAHFCLADVANLGILNVQGCLALDIGCFHAVPADRRRDYVASLAAHLLPGSLYLLYAFVLTLEEPAPPRGISPVDIGRFAPSFVLRWVQHGQDRERPSAWYLLERS